MGNPEVGNPDYNLRNVTFCELPNSRQPHQEQPQPGVPWRRERGRLHTLEAAIPSFNSQTILSKQVKRSLHVWIGKSWSHFSRVEHLCDSGGPRVNCHQETPAEAHALVDVIDVVMHCNQKTGLQI